MELIYCMSAAAKEHFDQTQRLILDTAHTISINHKKTWRLDEYTIEFYPINYGKGYISSCLMKVKREADIIAEFYRNYSSPMIKLIHHSNGKDYFFLSEDYQGYSVFDIEQNKLYRYLPNEAIKGFGWCPIEVTSYDEASNQLNVFGCYWACPYETNAYDFTDPTNLPLTLLKVYDDE